MSGGDGYFSGLVGEGLFQIRGPIVLPSKTFGKGLTVPRFPPL